MIADAIQLSVRETSNLIYPFFTPQALAKWIKKGVFRPSVHVETPAGPGTGSKLDFADLVTVGILIDLFDAGLTFRDFTIHGHTFQTSSIQFQCPLDIAQHRMLAQGVPFRDVVKYDDLATLGPRAIQRYLERLDFQVHVWVEVVRPLINLPPAPYLRVGDGVLGKQTVHGAIFLPKGDLKPYYSERMTAPAPYERILSISVAYWVRHVKVALALGS